jgi:tetratricopeptide (TPR) repeat protein
VGALLLVSCQLIFADAEFDGLMKSGKYKEAIDYADVNISPSDRDAAVWLKLARANEEVGMNEKALACYIVSWRLNQNDYHSLVGASKAYNNLNQPDNAINMAKKALEINFTADASWEYARACIALNRAPEAKASLEKVIQADPNNLLANRELGAIYFNEKSYERAIPLLRRAYIENADGLHAYRLGKSFTEVGIADSAIVYLKIAFGKGTQPDPVLDLARAYFMTKDYKNAIDFYSRISLESLTADDIYQKALSHENIRDQAAAVSLYATAVDRFGVSQSKNALAAKVASSRALIQAKNYDRAITLLTTVISADPNNADISSIYFLLAEAYQGSKEITKAIGALERVITADAKNVEAYARLADLYQMNGMQEKAKGVFESMLSLNPNDPVVYLGLGNYNLKNKKYDEALNQFMKSDVLKHTAESAEGIAVASYYTGDIEKARSIATKAISMNSSLIEARIILSKILIDSKEYSKAKEQLEMLSKQRNNDLDILKALSVCYFATGEQEKLIANDKKIASLSASDTDSRLRLAKIYEMKSEYSSAISYYKEIYQLNNDSDVLFKLFKLSAANKEQAAAIAFLQNYIVVNPSSAEAHRELGDLYYNEKKYDEALVEYRTALKLNPSIKGFHKRYAEIVIAKGQQDEVVTALTNLIKSGDADVGTYTTLGLIYEKKKNLQKAIEMYQNALILEPSNTDALNALANCQAVSGDIRNAIITYEQLVMMVKNPVVELKELGRLYLKDGKRGEGIKVFKQYLQKDSLDKEVLAIVGEDAFSNSEYSLAVKYLSMLGSSASDEQLLMYSEACEKTKNIDEQISALELLSGRKLKSVTLLKVMKMLADAFEQKGNDVKAAKLYGELFSLTGGNDADVAYKKAFYSEKTNLTLSTKWYEENCKKFPSDYRNYLRLGVIYSSKKENLSKSVTMLRKVVVLASSVPSVWLELGKVYGKLGDENEELIAYRRYAENDPQSVEANKQIGLILMKKGKINEAMVYLEIANTLQAGDIDIMIALARGYASTNRHTEAIELLQKAKDIDKNNTDILFQLFGLYQKTKQNTKAQAAIKELVSIKKDNKFILLYAESLLGDSNTKDALDAIENILATDPSNINALMLKAKIMRSEKNYDGAIDVYKEIAYTDPEYPPMLFERAETHFLQSKPQWAETFYKRALKADPKYGLAEYGLAKIAKLRKDKAGYKLRMDNAIKLDPSNQIIIDEYQNVFNN